jgi:hypothetical protein
MNSETLLENLFSVMALLLEYQPEDNFIKNGWSHNCKDPEGDQFVDCLRCQQALFMYQVWFNYKGILEVVIVVFVKLFYLILHIFPLPYL